MGLILKQQRDLVITVNPQIEPSRIIRARLQPSSGIEYSSPHQHTKDGSRNNGQFSIIAHSFVCYPFMSDQYYYSIAAGQDL